MLDPLFYENVNLNKDKNNHNTLQMTKTWNISQHAKVE